MSTQVSQLLFCNMSKSRTSGTTLISSSKSRTVQPKPTLETARRNLFGSDHEANAQTLREEGEKYHAQQDKKYNFNFRKDEPLENKDKRYDWEKAEGYIPVFYQEVNYADKPSSAAPISPVSDSVTPPIAQSRAKLTRADLARKVSPHLSNVKRKLSFSCSASPADQSNECSKNNHNEEPEESVSCSFENSSKISSDEKPPSVSTNKLKAITSSQSTSLITDYYVTRKRRRPSSSTSEEAEDKNAVESVGGSSSRQLKRKRLQPNQ